MTTTLPSLFLIGIVVSAQLLFKPRPAEWALVTACLAIIYVIA